MIKATPLLARTAGLLCHFAEEQERPICFLLSIAEDGLTPTVQAARMIHANQHAVFLRLTPA